MINSIASFLFLDKKHENVKLWSFYFFMAIVSIIFVLSTCAMISLMAVSDSGFLDFLHKTLISAKKFFN